MIVIHGPAAIHAVRHAGTAHTREQARVRHDGRIRAELAEQPTLRRLPTTDTGDDLLNRLVAADAG